MMNTTRDSARMDAMYTDDLPRRTVAQNTNTLGTRGLPSSGFLPGAECREPNRVMVRFPSETVAAVPSAAVSTLSLRGLVVSAWATSPQLPHLQPDASLTT